MKTTINTIVGRRDDACPHETVDETLEQARRIFADVTAFLQHEIDRLYGSDVDDEDGGRIKALLELIRQNQAAMRTVLEMRSRLDRAGTAEKAAMLDLEAARAEVLGRLSRLAS